MRPLDPGNSKAASRRIAGPSRPVSRASQASLGRSVEEMRFSARRASTTLGSNTIALIVFYRFITASSLADSLALTGDGSVAGVVGIMDRRGVPWDSSEG